MSEHGAFCTEYVNCSDCFEEAKKVLLDNQKFLCSTVVPPFSSYDEKGNELDKKCPVPIIAGKIGASSSGGEHSEMEGLIYDLEATLCHPMRIALMCENGTSTFFTIVPRNPKILKETK